eukprot:2867344-Prorocentrum_lima.AAC.1
MLQRTRPRPRCPCVKEEWPSRTRSSARVGKKERGKDNTGVCCIKGMCSSSEGWRVPLKPVSYTHLTLPTICSV